MAYDVIVVGGGPAGLMAAGTAAERGKRVLLIERNDRPARKLMITGKGRCNITNNTDINGLISNIPNNGKFLYSAFSAFLAQDTIGFFESRGVKLKTERGNRVFPKSDKAVQIVDCLVNYAKSSGVKIIKGRVTSLKIENDSFSAVILEDGKSFKAQSCVIATGGMSYPLTGSTGDGYKMARQAGHTIIEPKSSLVPLTVQEEWCFSLQGLTLKNVEVSLIDSRSAKRVHTEFGEMLFTHFGVSGPIILSLSAHIKPRNSYKISIDLKPALSEEQLDNRLLRDFEKYSNRNFSNALDDLLPQKLIPVVVELSGILPDTKVNQITKEQRKGLCRLLKNLTLNITGLRPIDEAIITRGGVNVKEIDPKTMGSRITNGLYFAGEVIDVDAYTGGFNLQIAFSTGYLAGKSV